MNPNPSPWVARHQLAAAGLALGLSGVDTGTNPSGSAVLSAPTSSWGQADLQPRGWSERTLQGFSLHGPRTAASGVQGLFTVQTLARPSPPTTLGQDPWE